MVDDTRNQNGKLQQGHLQIPKEYLQWELVLRKVMCSKE
jgi:hypothetical protein